MEYKEKPEGPFFVTFYVTNFTASDDSVSYKINITDFYGNCYESNIISKNSYRQINFSSNYIEICEETAIKDVIQSCIKINVLARSNSKGKEDDNQKSDSENNSDNGSNSFICIGSDNIKTFPFLHDQLIITRNVIVSYKCENRWEEIDNQIEKDQMGEPGEPGKPSEISDKKKKKKNSDKDEKKKKKKNSDKVKSKSGGDGRKSENCIKSNIGISFNITLNVNSLLGNYCERSSYNIMNMKVDGVYNIPKSVEDKISKKNLHTFQLKFLDFCMNDGMLVKDEQDKYKIEWKKNDLYKYRNIKEIEYIYNFLFYESFNVNAYLLCFNEGKKQKDNNSPSVVDFLCGRFEVNINDVISNKVLNAKYRLHVLDLQKGEVKNAIEKGDTNEGSFIYGGAYIMLTIKFYKPFFQREKKVEFPLKMDNMKEGSKVNGVLSPNQKEGEDIGNLFNRLILEGIQYVNSEINKRKNEEQIKIYKKSKEYLSFLNDLKENPTYINLYNNIKEVMIKMAYEIVKKKIYKNFNLHDDVMYTDDETEKKLDLKGKYVDINNINHGMNNTNEKNHSNGGNKKFVENITISEENTNCILAHLFNLVHESSNVIINGYCEKENNINTNALDEIKKKNNIKNVENYLFNVLKESEFLLKYKKCVYFCEATLVLLFKKILNSGENTEKKDLRIIENQDYNHVVNMLLNCEEHGEGENTPQDNYIYKKSEKSEKNNEADILTSIISTMQRKNSNCYLFDYINHFEKIILNQKNENRVGEETFVKDSKQENIFSTFNLPQNKEIKNLFIDVLYKYAKVLLISNNNTNCETQKKQQRLYYEQYCAARDRKTDTAQLEKGIIASAFHNINEYDNFEYHDNFDLYEKYLNGENMDSCISCLSAYVELTNFENLESIFILTLVYLNTHKYDKAMKLASYLIQVLKKKERKKMTRGKETNRDKIISTPPLGDTSEEENPWNIKQLYLYSTFNYSNINISVEICIYIKALCFFFQRNYVNYYINMSILLNNNENNLRSAIEKTINEFNLQKETRATIGRGKSENSKAKNDINNLENDKDKTENEPASSTNDGEKKKEETEKTEKAEKTEKTEKTEKKEKTEKNWQNGREGRSEGKTKDMNEQIDTDKEETKHINDSEEVKTKGRSSIRKEKQNSVLENETEINLPEAYLSNHVPVKDIFMFLFLIHCIKFNILNIVMFIHENRHKFLTELSLETPLYRHLIIRAFFALAEFAKCIELIEETKEHLKNFDMLYIYAESAYKLKDYRKSMVLLKQCLYLCRMSNVRVKIYLQLSKVYISLNQYEDSKKEIKKSLDVCKTSYSYLYLAHYYLKKKKKKYMQAYKFLHKSNEMNLFNHKLWAYFCITFLHLGMKDEADKCLGNFIKMKKYDKMIISEMLTAYKMVEYEKGWKILSTLHEREENTDCGKNVT
ncbi:hypothetical protein, conserved [Plasmodium gonderi]|uniref:Tetratricopeptide repeat protein n=1 Tax=Plasmodium gonderi TaxID=77519 RepID=A0A1Y1JER5_PLAGO|nr:hypothetical protein, conserved [Plasmodium gonderi]GAW79707.1 hypothetical protein, conserved [Plasmodium gonderi]